MVLPASSDKCKVYTVQNRIGQGVCSHRKGDFGSILRKQPTFRDATHHWLIPAKWRLRNKHRNSIPMTRHYPDLGRTVVSSKWNFCTRLSDIISQETRGGVAKCRLLACSRPSDSRERRGVKNSRKSEGDWRELSSLFLCLRRFHFFFFFFAPFFTWRLSNQASFCVILWLWVHWYSFHIG